MRQGGAQICRLLFFSLREGAPWESRVRVSEDAQSPRVHFLERAFAHACVEAHTVSQVHRMQAPALWAEQVPGR